MFNTPISKFSKADLEDVIFVALVGHFVDHGSDHKTSRDQAAELIDCFETKVFEEYCSSLF